MFSRSNHHHQRQRSSPPPPATGTRRQRSPEVTPEGSESEEGATTQYKISPKTKRIVKKGRTDEQPDATNQTTLDSESPQATQPDTTQRALSDTGPHEKEQHHSTQPIDLTTSVVGHMAHLDALLDSVLATLVIIQSASTSPLQLSYHTKAAFTTLNQLLSSSITRTASIPDSGAKPLTYAEATTTRPAASHKAAHVARSSPAGHQKRVAPPRTERTNRAIVRWPGHPVPQTSSSLESFVMELDRQMHQCQMRGLNMKIDNIRKIAAANVTKSGNLVLHLNAPFTAAQLLPHANAIQSSASFIPDFDPPLDAPYVELDVPWHGIVIHDLPTDAIKIAFEEDNPTRNIWAALHDEAGIMGKDVRGDVALMRREGEEYTDDRVSMRVMFEDPQICNRFCKEGITLLGTRCRVSHYRPRTRHGNLSFPSRPTSPTSPSHRPPLDADIGSTKQTNDHIDKNHGH